MKVAFLGVGHMGEPMARNLLRAGFEVTVWNRTPAKCAPLVAAGARQADGVDDALAGCDVAMLMLLDQAAVDATLGRHGEAFAARVRGRTLVHLGTTSPAYSQALEHDVRVAGGTYVEAPVSGSRGPAIEGRLVGMVAGDDVAVARVRPLLDALCARVLACGAVPGALRMKLAANHVLIGLVAVLAEATDAARAVGLDLRLLQDVIAAGPMDSAVSRDKLAMLVAGLFPAHAAIRDVSTIATLVVEHCIEAGRDAPLIRETASRYRTALAAGFGDADMAAVVHAFAAGTDATVDATEGAFPVACVAAGIPSRARRSLYPPPFDARVAGRDKKALGDVFGLRRFGVNLTRLAPGAQSALRHAHARQDEFVFVLEGTPVLRTDAGETALAPGMCAGFRAGSGDAHHLVNRGDVDAVYLEIGDRTPGDRVQYPDDDLVAHADGNGWRFHHKDGRPYPTTPAPAAGLTPSTQGHRT
ncbi:MAG: cupin domain-containing protein [Xanthomonadales bacterium]|nr:cupin domain-containing protein [Xanthomonadales bacterium]